jgi:hypothetical protein
MSLKSENKITRGSLFLKMSIVISICFIIGALLGAFLYFQPWKFDIKGTITKGLIGKQDLALYYNGDSAGTFTRATSTGYAMTLNKLDWVGVDVCQVYGGGVNKTDTQITDALTAIGTTTYTELWLSSGTWTISNDLNLATYPNIYIRRAPGALLSIATGKTLTIYSPFNIISPPNEQIFTGSGTVLFTNKGTVYPEWFGSDGIDSGLESLADGGTISFTGGLYETLGVSVTLAGDITFEAVAPTIIKCSSSTEINYLCLIYPNKFDVRMKGDITFDGNNKARKGLTIYHDTASMDDASNVILDNIKGINAYSTDTVGESGSYGIQITGGYDNVTLTNCGAKDISRVAGVAGGSGGISIWYLSTTAYPKNVTVINPNIDTVTSLEADGDPTNVDCDGLMVAAPGANSFSGINPDVNLHVIGGVYRNCRGRSIKSQMVNNLIEGPIFIRDASATKSIANGQEVDFQYGSGTLKDFKCIYRALTGGGTPFGASHTVVNATVNDYGTESGYSEGSLTVENGEIINNYPYTSGNLPYFITLANTDSDARFSMVNVQNIKFTGSGKIGSFVYGDLAQVRNLIIRDTLSTRGTYLIYSTTSAEACIAVLQNNKLYNWTGSEKLWKTDTGLPPILKDPKNNGYWNGISAPTDGQSVSLADDASYTFAPMENGLYPVYMITSSYARTANGVFTHDTYTNAILDLTGSTSTNIAYGSGSNPDTDNKLNVWVDANYCINIKNRLGSTRSFNLSCK